MTICDVCCEHHNKINHKKVECPFCDLSSCRSCSQRYILSSFEDPHCMGCKALWNREFVDLFCTKYFRNTELKRHREVVLFEREKARMPETQPEVERILQMRKLRIILNDQRAKLLDLHHMHHTHPEQEVQIKREIRDLYKKMENVWRHLEDMRTNGNLFIGRDQSSFIRQCPVEECKGFLNEEWYCGLCFKHYCKKCNELLTDDHECDPQTVETMELLNQDSKSCPKCGTVIYKTSGCAQMWCTSCHTAFDWRTGQIENGRIHNPHFIEFKKKTMMSREHGDIPCGGMPTFREMRENGAPNTILRHAVVIYQVERDLMFMDTQAPDNIQFRISYMLNEMSEDHFKILLQRQEKYLDKLRDISHIFEMIANTGGDLLRQFMLESHRHDEIIDILTNLIEYSNETFEVIRKRYNSAVPRKIFV